MVIVTTMALCHVCLLRSLYQCQDGVEAPLLALSESLRLGVHGGLCGEHDFGVMPARGLRHQG